MKLNGNAIAQSRKNQLSGQEILIYIDQKRIISRGNSVVTISKTKK
jgi:lipopolysaccharide export system protein LptA